MFVEQRLRFLQVGGIEPLCEGEPLLIAKSAFRFHHLMLGVTGSRMFEQSGCPSLPPLPDSAEQCYIEIGHDNGRPDVRVILITANVASGTDYSQGG